MNMYCTYVAYMSLYNNVQYTHTKLIIVHKIETQKSPKSKWKPESEVLKKIREMTREKRKKMRC